eukprot:jgi/Botrbrau1/13618/Bobra.0069s0014.1
MDSCELLSFSLTCCEKLLWKQLLYVVSRGSAGHVFDHGHKCRFDDQRLIWVCECCRIVHQFDAVDYVCLGQTD